MLHFDLSQKQSNHERNDARSDNKAFTDPQRASTKTRGESAHLVLHYDAEGLGKNGAVDTGHDEWSQFSHFLMFFTTRFNSCWFVWFFRLAVRSAHLFFILR